MRIEGVIVHHSVCSAINGKGYDFMITAVGTIVPAAVPTDSGFIHVCVQGDFNRPYERLTSDEKEQLFLLHKLVNRLSETFGFSSESLHPHGPDCPGASFPWNALVISGQDRYH